MKIIVIDSDGVETLIAECVNPFYAELICRFLNDEEGGTYLKRFRCMPADYLLRSSER